jgi:hypothetical protein
VGYHGVEKSGKLFDDIAIPSTTNLKLELEISFGRSSPALRPEAATSSA